MTAPSHALIVLFDGISTMFVTEDSLDTAWAVANGFVDTQCGLQHPGSLPVGIDIRIGDFDDVTAVFDIDDLDGTLPALFGADVLGSPSLNVTILPHDDPAPEFGAGLGQDVEDQGNVTLWGKHIGTEYIGPAGERRQYPCFPSDMIGARHLSRSAADQLRTGHTPVTDTPRVWTGRRVTVWRVAYQDGAWQNLDDVATYPRPNVWSGALLGQGRVAGRRWSFKAAGPEALIGGTMALGMVEHEFACRPLLKLDGTEGKYILRAKLAINSIFDEGEENPYELSQYYLWGSYSQMEYDLADFLTGTVTYEDLVAQIQLFLDDIVANYDDGGTRGEYDSPIGALGTSTSTLTFDMGAGVDGFHVRWDRKTQTEADLITVNNATVEFGFECHNDVWTALGYDPSSQWNLAPLDHPEFLDFGETDSEGRTRGRMYSMNAAAANWYVNAEDMPAAEAFSNGGQPRRWAPLYTGGGATWTLQPGQEFQLASVPGGGSTFDGARMFGTNSAPLLSLPDDPLTPYSIGDGVGAVNRQGLIAVQGPYRRDGDKDGGQPKPNGYAFDIERERKEARTVQVFRVGWREVEHANPSPSDEGMVVTDSEDLPRMVVCRVEDPKRYGWDWEKLAGTWAGFRDPPEDGRPFTCRPIVALEYTAGNNRADLIMLRALLSTGTAGDLANTDGYPWFTDDTLADPLYGLQQTPYFDGGENDLSASVPLDAEVPTIGRAVPAAMVAPAAAWKAIVQSVGANVTYTRPVFAQAFSSRQMFRDVLAQMGLSWSFAGGQFGIFDPTVFPGPDDAAYVVTPESYAGEAGNPASVRPSQEFRELAAIDRVEVKATRDPLSGSMHTSYERRATDMGAAYRAQTTTHRITAPHLIATEKPSWAVGFYADMNDRIRKICDFWAKAHFACTIDCHIEEAIHVWPGDGVLLTDPWMVDPSGAAYGVTSAAGRVIKRDFMARAGKIRLKVIVQASQFVLYSGAAVGTEYVAIPDPAEYTIGCIDDWLTCRTDGSVDVEQFAQPSWSDVTGQAEVDIEVMQFDATSLRRGCFGEVGSIVTTPGSTQLVLTGPLTGTPWYRDMHHVIFPRAYADQGAAWILQWLAPVCEADGTHDSTDGKAFLDS